MEINLTTWKRGSQRAPHKPLLLLYALGKWKNGRRDFPWAQVKVDVAYLIEQFGGNARPEASNPFVRLQKDGDGKIWTVDGPLVLDGSGNPSVKLLNENNNIARFTAEFENRISDRKVFDNLVSDLLVEHFSETQFEDLLQACGLIESNLSTYTKRKRDPEFRQHVLDAYNHKCAICDYDLRFRSTLIGVEAAHLQWHNSNGPDHITNGIALCAIHHKLLDYGAIGFNDNLEVMGSTGLNGSEAQLKHYVYDHRGKQIRLPQNGMSEPSVEYVRWQRKEIFKG